MKRFYITTPIYYINAEPSIGSACTTVAADVVARLHRQLGEEVFMLTGTDEHGEKVCETAEKAGLLPIDFCNQIAPMFKEAWKLLNIHNDFFIRTTDIRHEKVASEFLNKMYQAGDVYKDKYEGWYCTGCEAFKTEKELEDGHCPLHPPEKTVLKSEENWFFKLSKYIPKIIELIEDPNTNYIFPESKRLEILAKLKSGVNDVSISREKVKWGIPIPWDPDHTIYVWIDALINYYSATLFLENKKDFWPADVHLLGKEILWFHTVIWQAMLLSADIPLPKKTYVHDFYTIDGQKMSKSLGNTIPPKDMVELFGCDAARYLIVRSFPYNGDVDVGIPRFKEKYNADLANNFGNLVSRINKLNEESKIKLAKPNLKLDLEFRELIDDLKLEMAVDYVFKKYIDKANLFLNQQTPWKLTVDDPKRQEIITKCISDIVTAAYHLKSIMPESCENIINLFTEEYKPLQKSLFPRIA